ncbi:maker147 [Drosophila busckii]|uniref:Maker147 n=1 Tax=Drosophila busckii TaxID=30019 RepID=A0A0M4E7P6_DROBS|nr:general odorant-binding protein 56h [Drosophila busckii]ALC42766.1 maker147 [Drosophila busckii]
MKFILAQILLLSTLLAALQAVPSIEGPELLNSCMTVHAVNGDEILLLKNSYVALNSVSPNIKCVTKCVLEKLGYIDRNGALLGEVILKSFPDPYLNGELRKSLADCSQIAGANACDRAFNMLVCIEQHTW